MADQERRCLPPCQRQLSDEDLHAFCFECLGEEHAIRGLEGTASTAISSRSRCFVRGSPSLKARGDRVSIWPRHVRRIHPFLSHSHRIMKPSRPFSSEWADETSSLASGEVESATSVHSSRDEKAYEELLEVVTRAVDRLHLDWPQEQETSKRSTQLDDRYLSGGQGEGPQRRSLPFSGDLHDEVARSWNRPYSSRVLCHRRRLSLMQRHRAI